MDFREALDIHAPQHLDALSEAQLDAMPYGAIRVDHKGTILFYSRSQGLIANREPEAVIGRNFFSDVAPCTVVPEFYGRFRKGVLTGDLNTAFEFVFDFEMHPVQVRIAMRGAERPGEFWILVEPLRRLPPRDEQATEALISGQLGTPAGGEPAAGLSAVSFDFSQCDLEPIATCGAVQPFGCLLVLDPETLHIDACSANTALYLGVEAEELLGAPLERALASIGEAHPKDCLAPTDAAAYCPALFRARAAGDGSPIDVRLHRWRGRLLLEIEPHGEMAMDARMRGFDVAAFQCALQDSQDVASVCSEAVEVMRYLSGFERVLIYRFEPDEHGIVVGESLQGDAWPSVMGLHYPASDIPRQARALYRETPMRYAPSRDHSDIPLLSRDLAADQIDIGIAHVRAQSPVHRNYLQRFAVNGSMSLSIVHDGRLWGLVIFHHRAPHPVTAYVRQRLVEICGCLSGRLALLDERERNRASEQGMARVSRIVGEIDIEQPFPDNFAGKDRLLRELLDADMVQIYHRGSALFPNQGELTADEIAALLTFIKARPESIWSTDCLSGEFEPAASYPDRLAGVMAIFVDDRREYILLFGRRRVHYTVKWGADPASLPFGSNSEPRPFGWPNRVFQVWQEERTHHSRAWSPLAVATAAALKNLLQQVIVANAAHFERLSVALTRQRDQLHESREEMRHRALHDGLTGLPNRIRFREVLDEAIRTSRNDGHWFAVALLDIDHFKTINDTLGHEQGDILLCAVARRLAGALPKTALVARLGGDEFAVLLHPTDRGFLELAERVVESLRQPIVVGEDRFTITGSLGVTIGGGDADPGELLKQADLAMYQAKEDGRNCARPFDKRLETEVLKRLQIDRVVLGRSPTDAIEILLQPQFALCSSSPQRRFEVLARWRHEDGMVLMPGDFIPAAERNGIIRAVTNTVLHRAIALLSATAARGGPDMMLAINVAAADLEAGTFVRSLIDDLNAAQVAPASIEIEMTESLLLRMTPRVKASLHDLVAAGISLSLDDFGTGFSSMAYLRELPIASLKIDRLFIRGIEAERDRNLVAGMIAMAHSIGKDVIAEGVETTAQRDILTMLSCDWGQGYLWSRPVPPEEALRL